MPSPDPPPAIEHQFEELKFQNSTLLYLSAINLIMNVMTIAFAFVVAM